MSPSAPPRIEGFSYRGPHQYFLTICTKRRRRVFEDAAAAAAIVEQIPHYFEEWQLAVIAYCVMPDHMHLVLEGVTEGADLLGAIRGWKQHTGYAWMQRTGGRLWQRGFYDHVLRREESLVAVVRYVVENPVRSGLVDDPLSYRWLGSSRYTMEELRNAATEWRPAEAGRPEG